MLVVGLLAAFDLEGILEADGLDYEFERDSLFSAEGEALIDEDVDGNTRI